MLRTSAAACWSAALAAPLEREPFTTFAGPPEWDGEAAWRAELVGVARDVIRPAFVRYRDCFRAELLPAARPHEQPGLSWLGDDGEALYRHVVRRPPAEAAPPVATVVATPASRATRRRRVLMARSNGGGGGERIKSYLSM